jgi:hypothetical protein
MNDIIHILSFFTSTLPRAGTVGEVRKVIFLEQDAKEIK